MVSDEIDTVEVQTIEEIEPEFNDLDFSPQRLVQPQHRRTFNRLRADKERV